jgi:hypothetical protein
MEGSNSIALLASATASTKTYQNTKKLSVSLLFYFIFDK